MDEHRRLLTKIVLNEHKEYQKMIFLSGPRQVGKTTLLKQLISRYPGPILNWDNLDDRTRIAQSADGLFADNRNIYFDEIHKQPRWKNFLRRSSGEE